MPRAKMYSLPKPQVLVGLQSDRLHEDLKVPLFSPSQIVEFHQAEVKPRPGEGTHIVKEKFYAIKFA